MTQKAHGPTCRRQPDQQGEKERDEIRIRIAEQRARQKPRSERSQNAGAKAGFPPSKAPCPEKHEHGHKAGHDWREPKGHSGGGCSGGQSQEAEEFGHGVTRSKRKPFRPGHPVIGVMRGQKHFIAEAEFGVLPGSPFLKTQPKRRGVGDCADQQPQQPDGCCSASCLRHGCIMSGTGQIRHGITQIFVSAAYRRVGLTPGGRGHVC